MYYVLDEHGNRKEAYTKEEFLSFMQQAIANGDLAGIDADSAFVSKLKCCVGGGTFQIAFATQELYNELKEQNKLITNTLYFITDDTTAESLEAIVEEVIKGIEGLDKTLGELPMSKVTEDENNVLHKGETIIPQKKILWQGYKKENVGRYTETAFSTSITLSEEIKQGDTIRILMNLAKNSSQENNAEFQSQPKHYDFKYYNASCNTVSIADIIRSKLTSDNYQVYYVAGIDVVINGNTLTFTSPNLDTYKQGSNIGISVGYDIEILEVSKIIE